METAASPFLARFLVGPAGRTVWEPWNPGFLCLVYDDDGRVLQAAWVPVANRNPRGGDLQVWFDWANDMVTFKTERGLGGSFWSDGYVQYGTVWDDDGEDAGPGRQVDLDAWVEECVESMVAAGQDPGISDPHPSPRSRVP